MANDLTKSKILFPFTPDSSPHRALVTGLNDCFMVIPSAGAAGSPLPFRDYFLFLYSIVVNPGDVVYNFKASFPGGIQDLPFTVTKDQGIVRVSTGNSAIHAIIIVDSDNMYDVAGTHLIGDTPYAEIEPAKIVWRTDTLTSIRFRNAYRHWDPSQRNADGSPFTDVLTVTGGPLQFESGYNVSLQYDEDVQTLYVRGIPGAGKGLPDTIPWDVGPPASAADYIKSINGKTGAVKIVGSDNIEVSQTDTNELTLEVLDA